MPLTQLLAGIDGAEGPVFDRLDRFFMVEPHQGRVLRVDLDARTPHDHANTAGIPAGLMLNPTTTDNRIYIADMKRGILSVDASDSTGNAPVREEVVTFEGNPIRGCNDLVFDFRGNLYFTAPAGSGPGKPHGEVFHRRPDGSVARFDRGFQFCNGISVAPGDHTLIVAETHTKSLWAYDLDDEGEVASKRRLFAKLSGTSGGGPDGIDFTADGTLIATNWGGACLDLFDPAGKTLDRFELPFDKPSNLHFGGPQGKDLYLTEHTHHALWHTPWPTKGHLTA